MTQGSDTIPLLDAPVADAKPQAALEAVRAKLNAAKGRTFWRSLEELSGDQAFEQYVQDEFPRLAAVWPEGVSRRRFMQVMAASLALGGLNACTRQSNEAIVPYVKQPEGIVPGKPLFFATAHVRSGVAHGILVESHMGRPTHVEGNPEHPQSLGAADSFAQASVLSLYDPDRSQTVLNLSQISSWDAFGKALAAELPVWREKKGEGLAILSGHVTSPTLLGQIKQLREQMPAAKWYSHEPAGFGDPLGAVYDFTKADVVVALDSDFMASSHGNMRYARDFISRRRDQKTRLPAEHMNRLYVAEPMPTVTGSNADHRLAVKASKVQEIALRLASALGVPNLMVAQGGEHTEWIAAVAEDLRKNKGKSLVVVGETQPREVHELVAGINKVLDNVGGSIRYARATDTPSLEQLTAELNAEKVETLLIIGVNPAYDAPADLDFATAIEKARLRIHHGVYADETAGYCHWHLPATHELESWSDAVAYDGTVSVIQPLIAPMYDGRSVHALLSMLTDATPRKPYEIVREHWRAALGADGFEKRWRKAVHDGVVEGGTGSVELTNGSPASPRPGVAASSSGLELVFKPDPTIWDGRYANNGWLQELPKPISKLTWDNAAHMSVATAAKLGVKNRDVVKLEYLGRSVEAPVWIVPGCAEDSVTVHLGYGRTSAGRVGNGAGFNAYALRTSDAPWFGGGLTVTKTGKTNKLATTQDHQKMEGRDFVRIATLEEHLHPHVDPHDEGAYHLPQISMYPEYDYSQGHKWGMVIDLTSCIGCNGCVTACVSENNIPVVGKEQVEMGREMHWIRIDRYFESDPATPDDAQIVHQPLPCMQCEKAPCEPVCPVGATLHSDEGLNEMTYNRCIGTRYCANNCPYKVRHFNFLQYSDISALAQLQKNPDVTVRTRGVMEKCTYCVQRIESARITAGVEGRPIRDGDADSACAQACPTDAIVFGDLNDKSSRIATLVQQKHHYTLLEELNTKPRTTYLARYRNPNPELEPAGHAPRQKEH